MLVLSRMRDEAVILGNERTIHIDLADDDLKILRDCKDPSLANLFGRLLAATPGIIKVTVVDIRPEKTRLGFDAAFELKIHREEVYRTILRTKQTAQRAQSEGPTSLVDPQT